MGDDSSVGVAVWVTMVISLAIGSTIGVTVERHEWKKKMIDYGYAQYDSETGEWSMINRGSTDKGHVEGDKVIWDSGIITSKYATKGLVK